MWLRFPYDKQMNGPKVQPLTGTFTTTVDQYVTARIRQFSEEKWLHDQFDWDWKQKSVRLQQEAARLKRDLQNLSAGIQSVSVSAEVEADLYPSDVQTWSVTDTDSWPEISGRQGCLDYDADDHSVSLGIKVRLIPPQPLDDQLDMDRFGRRFPKDIPEPWKSKNGKGEIVPVAIAFTRPEGSETHSQFPFTYLIYRRWDVRSRKLENKLRYSNLNNWAEDGELTGKLRYLLAHTPMLGDEQVRLVHALFVANQDGAKVLQDFKLGTVGPNSYKLERTSAERDLASFRLYLHNSSGKKEISLSRLIQLTDG